MTESHQSGMFFLWSLVHSTILLMQRPVALTVPKVCMKKMAPPTSHISCCNFHVICHAWIPRTTSTETTSETSK